MRCAVDLLNHSWRFTCSSNIETLSCRIIVFKLNELDLFYCVVVSISVQLSPSVSCVLVLCWFTVAWKQYTIGFILLPPISQHLFLHIRLLDYQHNSLVQHCCALPAFILRILLLFILRWQYSQHCCFVLFYCTFLFGQGDGWNFVPVYHLGSSTVFCLFLHGTLWANAKEQTAKW